MRHTRVCAAAILFVLAGCALPTRAPDGISPAKPDAATIDPKAFFGKMADRIEKSTNITRTQQAIKICDEGLEEAGIVAPAGYAAVRAKYKDSKSLTPQLRKDMADAMRGLAK